MNNINEEWRKMKMNVKNSSQNTVKKYEELTFTDDFMFCKVMQNNPDLCIYTVCRDYRWMRIKSMDFLCSIR